jgi:peptidoglycan/xylan/chitin deacetylase (PgdA/CDA1 family)
LYYHAVNDSADPFFPAMAPAVFERQIAYVARNHKVVRLSELLAHLESGVPGNAVAITFDDGYADNYECAFPILRRYGLPATIFLTTGPIDSREPLWFERLAEAVKTTSREFLDMELDVPRRLWMRTVAERLQANDDIYAVMREMPNTARERLLARILCELRAGESGRRGRMLTWDQIRHMKQHGIEFGGHTVTHPFLSRLTREEAVWEVSLSRRRIEEELQCTVSHFAYPSGRPQDFTDWNREVLKTAGYSAAVTTVWGVNDSSSDPMALKRGQPWEENTALFGYKLDWYELVSQ